MCKNVGIRANSSQTRNCDPCEHDLGFSLSGFEWKNTGLAANGDEIFEMCNLTPYTGLCRFFLSVKVTTLLLTSLAEVLKS